MVITYIDYLYSSNVAEQNLMIVWHFQDHLLASTFLFSLEIKSPTTV